MNAKLTLSFSKYSDASLESKAASILQMLTGNPNFPTPVPSLAELQAALTAYETALVAAHSRDIVKVAAKRATRTALENLLANLGMYIMWVANGNEEMLISSGFDLSKQREPVSLQEPGVVTVSNGNSSGRLVASIKKVKGAYSYVYQVTADPLLADGTWTNMTLNSSKGIFENLTPGQRYYIRVAAVGSGTQIAYSPVSSHIAL